MTPYHRHARKQLGVPPFIVHDSVALLPPPPGYHVRSPVPPPHGPPQMMHVHRAAAGSGAPGMWHLQPCQIEYPLNEGILPSPVIRPPLTSWQQQQHPPQLPPSPLLQYRPPPPPVFDNVSTNNDVTAPAPEGCSAPDPAPDDWEMPQDAPPSNQTNRVPIRQIKILRSPAGLREDQLWQPSAMHTHPDLIAEHYSKDSAPDSTSAAEDPPPKRIRRTCSAHISVPTIEEEEGELVDHVGQHHLKDIHLPIHTGNSFARNDGGFMSMRSGAESSGIPSVPIPPKAHDEVSVVSEVEESEEEEEGKQLSTGVSDNNNNNNNNENNTRISEFWSPKIQVRSVVTTSPPHQPRSSNVIDDLMVIIKLSSLDLSSESSLLTEFITDFLPGYCETFKSVYHPQGGWVVKAELYLLQSQLDPQSLDRLLTALEHHAILPAALHLGSNPNLGPAGLEVLAKFVRRSSIRLKWLAFSKCGVTGAAIRELLNAMLTRWDIYKRAELPHVVPVWLDFGSLDRTMGEVYAFLDSISPQLYCRALDRRVCGITRCRPPGAIFHIPTSPTTERHAAPAIPASNVQHNVAPDDEDDDGRLSLVSGGAMSEISEEEEESELPAERRPIEIPTADPRFLRDQQKFTTQTSSMPVAAIAIPPPPQRHLVTWLPQQMLRQQPPPPPSSDGFPIIIAPPYFNLLPRHPTVTPPPPPETLLPSTSTESSLLESLPPPPPLWDIAPTLPSQSDAISSSHQPLSSSSPSPPELCLAYLHILREAFISLSKIAVCRNILPIDFLYDITRLFLQGASPDSVKLPPLWYFDPPVDIATYLLERNLIHATFDDATANATEHATEHVAEVAARRNEGHLEISSRLATASVAKPADEDEDVISRNVSVRDEEGLEIMARRIISEEECCSTTSALMDCDRGGYFDAIAGDDGTDLILSDVESLEILNEVEHVSIPVLTKTRGGRKTLRLQQQQKRHTTAVAANAEEEEGEIATEIAGTATIQSRARKRAATAAKGKARKEQPVR